MQNPHILIVEDEAVTRTTLRKVFEAEGYDVTEASDGAEMHNALKNNNINLVVMDINLPGKNGLILAEELKSIKKLALIFLTGRDDDVDKVRGLAIGADDYITKPYKIQELILRARNVLARVNAIIEKPNEPVSDYRFHGWTLEINSRSLIDPQGGVHKLPRSEFRALLFFVENPGKILSREELLSKMTGRELKPLDRTVDVTVRRIREHFEKFPETPEILATIHGEGYRFRGKLD